MVVKRGITEGECSQDDRTFTRERHYLSDGIAVHTVYSKDLLGNTKRVPGSRLAHKKGMVQYAFEQFQTGRLLDQQCLHSGERQKQSSFSYRDNLWKGSDLLATGIASFGHASGVHYRHGGDVGLPSSSC